MPNEHWLMYSIPHCYHLLKTTEVIAHHQAKTDATDHLCAEPFNEDGAFRVDSFFSLDIFLAEN